MALLKHTFPIRAAFGHDYASPQGLQINSVMTL
jgi:hypothetical protein